MLHQPVPGLTLRKTPDLCKNRPIPSWIARPEPRCPWHFVSKVFRMKNDLSRLACGVVLCFFLSAPVLAEIDDMSTTTCKEFNAQKSMDLLYWMAGFHATEAQGTVVDNKKLGAAIDQTVAYCAENPGHALMTAADKYMGENLGEAGPGSVDVATVTCADFGADATYKDTFVWMMGYHAASNKEPTLIDTDRMAEDGTKIGQYCTTHPKVGLLKATEKFLVDPE